VDLQLKSLVLSKQFCNFRVESLFRREICFLVPPFNQFFDLMLNLFLFCFRLFAFADLIFIVHKIIYYTNLSSDVHLPIFFFASHSLTFLSKISSGSAPESSTTS